MKVVAIWGFWGTLNPVIDDLDRVNLPCLIHDTRLCQQDVITTDIKLAYGYKASYDVKTAVHNI